MPAQIVTVWSDYAQAFSAISDSKRRQIVSRMLAANVSYVVPAVVCNGHEGVIEDMEGFQKTFPGGHFVSRSESVHHDVALIEWQLILADGTGAAVGHDAIHLSPEGMIDSITTFAKAAPPQ